MQAAPVQTRRPGRSTEPLPRVAFILSQFPEMHETFILRELAALDEAGLDFVIFSLKPCRDAVVQSAAARFVTRTFYPWQSGRGGFMRGTRAALACRRALPWQQPLKTAYVAWAACQFAGLAKRLRISHVHAHWATAPTSAAMLISRILEMPFSFTAHAWDIFAGDGRLGEKAREARFVVTCTAANVDRITSLVDPADRGKVLLNYHGIPRALRPPAGRGGNGALRVAAVGRMVETKGFEILLEALAAADFPARLVLVGDGPLRRRLERKAARLEINAVFRGPVANEEVFEILSESDAFVMPSVIARNGDRDGIPNVMLEAMSVGLPVVASAISGIPEAVRHGRTGILVPPGNPAAIRDALRRIHADRAEAAQMGAEGRRLVTETFSAERNAAALYGIFKRHLAPAGK